MDLSTTIIGLLMLAIFILPFLLISRSGKSKKRRFEKEFFSEVSRNELKITEKDFCNEFAIGLEASTKKIIFFDWSGLETFHTVFSLKEVKAFETIPGKAELNRKNFNYHNVERLCLRFHFKDESMPPLTVTFYQPGFGKLGDEELLLFKKWMGIVKKKMDSDIVENARHSA